MKNSIDNKFKNLQNMLDVWRIREDTNNSFEAIRKIAEITKKDISEIANEIIDEIEEFEHDEIIEIQIYSKGINIIRKKEIDNYNEILIIKSKN